MLVWFEFLLNVMLRDVHGSDRIGSDFGRIG